ncbi:MAG: hypothetical protein WBP59_13340 [Ilumatobacteraceae bacterium]
MRHRSPRSMITAVSMVAASLLLAGCFSVEYGFTIHDDGTADVKLTTLIDTEQFEELSSLMGEDMGDLGLGDLSGDALLQEMMGDENPCGDLAGALNDYDVQTQEVNDDGMVGVECSVQGVPIEALNNSQEDDGLEFVIEQDESGTRFTATLEGVDEITGETGDMTAMLGMDLDDIFTIVFTVTGPGSLGETNASSTSGSTATWNVGPDASFLTNGDATLNAEWTPGGGSSSSSTLWIILGVIAAAVIIGAIVFVVSKRGKSGDTPSGPGGAPLDPMTPPTAPATTPPPPPGAPTPPIAAEPPTTPPPPPSGFSPPPPPPTA